MARRLIPAGEAPLSAAILAGWLVEEWAHLYPDWDHATAVTELLATGDRGRPPCTWLLFDTDDLTGADDGDAVDVDADVVTGDDGSAAVIGSVGLALDGELGDALDGDAAPEGVWLVNLFVTPSARGRGHGSALLAHAVGAATALGLPELLLTTEHSAEHYASVGWASIGTTSLAGHRSIIMRLHTMTR